MRKERRVFVGIVVVMAMAGHGLSMAGTAPQLKRFLEHSDGRWASDHDNGLPPEYEDTLYRWAKAGASIAELRARTAKTYAMPDPAAATLVDLTLERGGQDRFAPGGEPTPELVARYVALAKAYPDNDLALVEAARVVDGDRYRGCDTDAFHRLLEGRPNEDAARVLIFDHVWCLPMLTERTGQRPDDPVPYLDLAERADEISSEMLRLAILRVADDRWSQDTGIAEVARADLRKRRVLAELAGSRLQAGLARLPSAPTQWPALLAAFDGDQRRLIAASYQLQGDPARARQWLATVPEPPARPADNPREQSQAQARQYQHTLLQRVLEGDTRDDFAFLTRHFELDDTLGTTGGAGDIWGEVFGRYATSLGYPAFVTPSRFIHSPEERVQAEADCSTCAPAVRATIAELAATVPQARVAVPPPTDTPLPEPARSAMARVLAMPRPAWQEQPLPAQWRSVRRAAPSADGMQIAAPREAAAPPSEAWMQRLPAGSLVRHARQGQRIVAITASQTLDPTGEISAGGYWVSVSEDGGASFAPPLYTGLRMYAPYVVLPTSKLPMLEGDRLRLEVAVRELDNDHIMLPPVSLPFLAQRDDVYIEASLAELARDGDGDGLTDLAEWGMVLAPDNPDTDGDGLSDGEDPLPQIASSTRPPGAEAMAAVLNQIFGKDLGAIITTDARDAQPGRAYAIGRDSAAFHADHTAFMAGPPEHFAGLALSRRVLVLSPSQLQALSKARGTMFAMGIHTFVVSHDGQQALAVWSTGWAGGTYRLKREGQGWKVEPLSGWIT